MWTDLECHETLAGVSGDDLRLQESFGVLGAALAHPDTLLRFGPSVSGRLAHFLRHEHSVLVDMLSENVGGALHRVRGLQRGACRTLRHSCLGPAGGPPTR